MVDYAVTLVVDDAGISGDQLDYLTLQSNQVENSYREVKEHPTLVYAISELKTFVTEDLLKGALESGKTRLHKQLLVKGACFAVQCKLSRGHPRRWADAAAT